MKESPATDVDRAALETVKKLGMTPVEVSLPNWPYDSLDLILLAEAAAAFEELALSGRTERAQSTGSRCVAETVPPIALSLGGGFCPGRSDAAQSCEGDGARLPQVDLLLVPSLRDEMLTITNFTGHPSLTLRAGYVEVEEARSDWAPDPNNKPPKFSPPRRVPHGVTLIGRLFDEGTIGQVGLALERAFNVAGERPRGF